MKTPPSEVPHLQGVPYLQAQYLFYGEGAKHREFARHADGATIFIRPDINKCCVQLDANIASFSLKDLKKEEDLISEESFKRVVELTEANTKPFNQCVVIRNAGTEKQRRCGSHTWKGNEECFAHYKKKIATVLKKQKTQ